MLSHMYILLVTNAQHIIMKFKIIVCPLFVLIFLRKTMTQLIIIVKYRTPISIPNIFLKSYLLKRYKTAGRLQILLVTFY